MSEGTPTSSNFAARDRQEMAASGITPLSAFCTQHHHDSNHAGLLLDNDNCAIETWKSWAVEVCNIFD